MADFYTLTKASIQALQKDHQKVRTLIENLQWDQIRSANKAVQRDDYLVGKAMGGVSAISGGTMSSGTFKVQDVARTGVLTDTGRQETVYNVGSSEISANAYVPIERDYITGTWIARDPAGSSSSGTTVDISYVKAQEYWQHGGTWPSAGGGMAWVSVKKCDQDGTGVTGDAFDVYLPAPPHMDPNVVVDQVFCAAEFEDQSDSATSWASISDISDLAIGSVKMMTGNAPTAAHGWDFMDGNQDTNTTSSGTAINFTGRMPIHASPGTAAGTLNASTSTTSTTPDTVTTSSVAAAVSISGASANTSTEETGIESTDATDPGTVEGTPVSVEGEDMNPTSVVGEITGGDDLEHSHTITDPGHNHEVTVSVTGTAASHAHTVPGDPHSHEIELQATMGVYFYERIDNSGANFP